MLCMENTRVVGTVVERGRITTNARDVVAEWRKREKKGKACQVGSQRPGEGRDWAAREREREREGTRVGC